MIYRKWLTLSGFGLIWICIKISTIHVKTLLHLLHSNFVSHWWISRCLFSTGFQALRCWSLVPSTVACYWLVDLVVCCKDVVAKSLSLLATGLLHFQESREPWNCPIFERSCWSRGKKIISNAVTDRLITEASSTGPLFTLFVSTWGHWHISTLFATLGRSRCGTRTWGSKWI